MNKTRTIPAKERIGFQNTIRLLSGRIFDKYRTATFSNLSDYMTAKEHYETHLADVYSWMLGEFDVRMAEQRQFFVSHGIRPHSSESVAIDLGAGNGIQSVALAGLGFRVISVDFNNKLLNELKLNKSELSIEIREQDIVMFIESAGLDAEVIVCMGDTLTHLSCHQEVDRMIAAIGRCLGPLGYAIFSYRDFGPERTGTNRFFHVKSDDNRSMTCFLEYFHSHVMVHDIIIEKKDTWIQKVSSYPKLRIPVEIFKQKLESNGVAIVSQLEVRGMTYLVGQKN